MSGKTITVGFIGLGNIGMPMAKNLARKGPEMGLAVCVFDVVEEPVTALAELGAKAASPAEIAESCEMIGLCVRDDNDVDDLLYGADGILERAKAGTVIAVHSTVLRKNVLRWAEDAKAKGLELIDAPITGGAAGAEAGTLCIMAGGGEAVIERARPYFDCMSTVLVHAGEVGSGIVLKLANNLMTYAQYTTISEAHGLVKGAGVDPERLYEVGKANGVIAGSMHQFITGREGVKAGGQPGDMDKYFGPFASLGEKDLDHALALAEELGLDLPQGKTVRAGIRDTFLKGVV